MARAMRAPMRALPYFFRPRWQLFREHHHRLRETPDPGRAHERFERRLGLSMKVSMFRIVCYVGLYLSALVAGVSLVLDSLRLLPELNRGMNVLEATSSSLGLTFVLAILAAGRLLRQLELDMTFLSAESRIRS